MDRERAKAPSKPVFRAIISIVNFMDKIKSKLTPPRTALLNMTTFGMITSRSIYIAAELGLPDLLKDKPMNIEEIANATGVHA
ncbi:MAG: hypothetical protein AB1847_21815, partial [bacterium]